MPLFRKKSDLPDVDSYYRKRKYWKLFPLLKHENSIIVEKAIKALNDLIADDDAYQLRKSWATFNVYNIWIESLESESLIIYKEAIDPIVQTLLDEQTGLQEGEQKEQSENEAIIGALDARGRARLHQNTLKELREFIEDGEYIEYGQQFYLGLWVKSSEGILLTNKRIIYFYGIYLGVTINAITYQSITSVNKGFNNVKLISNEGPDIKYLNHSGTHKLTSLIEEKICP